ncbi:hypothetical protein KAT92_04245 [Candidatus Babeliales bacterium]|nr:hypothetical protein [Candidatus Babeliales bacterium]
MKKLNNLQTILLALILFAGSHLFAGAEGPAKPDVMVAPTETVVPVQEEQLAPEKIEPVTEEMGEINIDTEEDFNLLEELDNLPDDFDITPDEIERLDLEMPRPSLVKMLKIFWLLPRDIKLEFTKQHVSDHKVGYATGSAGSLILLSLLVWGFRRRRSR